MSRFLLTAQIQLQAPSNSKSVLREIRRDLGSGRPVSIPVEVSGTSEARRQIQSITRETELASSAAESLGRNFGIAIRRFAAFTIASRAVSLFTNSLANAIDDSIDFQREIIKISQVTGDSVKELKGLQNTITELSTSLGTSSKDLLNVTRIFSQAGIAGRDLEIALSGIAKTTLAPTFENIEDTAEGAVAILSQFKQGVRSLENQLGSINTVAGKFAVESDDLIGAVRRFGGVFKASGGSLEELLAVFTSVRATTRESAETIATGLRTIFTRIQRPKTIKFLEDLGIKLTDINGKFVGPFEAAQRLGKALEGLTEGDTRFIAVAEELGGFRQIGKVIPLIRQYKLAQEALNAAQQGSTSLSDDAATAQQALAVQITKVKEEFFALVRGITETTTFQVLVKTTLSLASAFIKVAEALKPVIPLIGALATFQFAKGIGTFIGGVGATLSSVRRRSAPDDIIPFAKGGFVPGSGNRDTVPAMLTPGEFVIRKSSVRKIGLGKLSDMNQRGYNSGGPIKEFWQMTPEEQAEERKRLQQLEDERSIQRSIGRSQTPTWRDENMRRGKYGRGYRKYASGGPIKEFWQMTPEEQAEERKRLQRLEDERSIQKSIGKMQSNTWRDEDLRRGYGRKYRRYNAGGKIKNIVQELRDITKTAQLSKRGRAEQGIGSIVAAELKNADLDYGGIFLGPKDVPKPDFSGTVEGKAIQSELENLPSFKILDRFSGKNSLLNQASRLNDPTTSPEMMTASTISADNIKSIKNKIKTGRNYTFSVKSAGLKDQYVDEVEGRFIEGILSTVDSGAQYLGSIIGQKIPDIATPAKFLKDINVDNIIGNLFEGTIARTGAPFAGSGKDEANSPIDFPSGINRELADAFDNGNKLIDLPTDAKAKYSSDSLVSFIKKIKNFEASRRARQIDLALLPYADFIKKGQQLTSTVETDPFPVTSQEVASLISSRADALKTQLNEEARPRRFTSFGKNAGGRIKLNRGSFGRGVKGFGPHRQPLVDDLKNTPDALMPNPKVAIPAILSSGYASLDLDRTLFRTIGDQAYMKAKTDEQRDEVLKRYFRDPVARLNDVRTAKLTQFGEQLRQLVKKKKIDPSNLSIISKSSAVPGLKEYVSQVFGIPTKNMEFTSGGEKSVALDRNRVYGPASKRKPIKRAAGGGISSSDTVPALLTPGEFVINKQAAQKIGYNNLNRMNKKGVVGFNKGGGVNVKKFNQGDRVTKSEMFIRKKINEGQEGIKGLGIDMSNAGSFTSIQKVLDKIQSDIANDNYAEKELKIAEGIVKILQEDLDLNRQKIKEATKEPIVEISDGKNSSDRRPRGGSVDNPIDEDNRVSSDGFGGLGKSLFLISGVSAAASTALEFLAKTTDKTSATQALVNDVLNKSVTAATGLVSSYTALNSVIQSNLIRDDKGNLTGQTKIGNAITNFAERGPLKGSRLSGFAKGLGGFTNKLIGLAPKLLTASTFFTGALTVASVGASALAASFERAAEKAVDAGDAVTAAESTLNASWWSYVNDNFLTFSGLLNQANLLFFSLFDKGQTYADFLDKEARETNKKVAEISLEATKAGVADTVSKLQKDGEFGSRGQAGFSQAGISLIKNVAETNARIQAVRASGKDDSKASELQRQLDEEFKTAVTEFVNRGAEEEQVRRLSSAYKEASIEARQTAERFIESSLATREASKALVAAKFDSLKITSAFASANSAVKTFNDSLVTGSNTLQLYTDELNASRDVIGFDAGSLIDSIEKELIKSADAVSGSGRNDLKNAISSQANLARAANQFSKNAGSVFSDIDLSAVDPTTAREQIQQALEDAIPKSVDASSRKKIETIIAERISQVDPLSGAPSDISEIIKDITSSANQLAEGFSQASSLQASHNQKIADLYTQREQLEQKFADSANQAIETQLEAGKLFEQFGGKRLTGQQQLAARIQQFNNIGQVGGLGVSLRTGEAGDIRRVSSQIGNIFRSQQNQFLSSIQQGRGGIFSDATGISEDKREEARKADQQLINFTKQRITLLQEELKIVEQKNKAEQDALDKLIGGDIEGFISGQAAAGAAAALRSGSSNLAGLFSGSALGAGFKTLKDQGLSDAELTRAAGLTLGNFGITDATSAGVLAGVSPEAQAIKEQGRELASTLGEIAKQQADFDMSDISINEATISANNVRFLNRMSEITSNNAGTQMRASGGLIYANKGIFVPRGTDTVPAMLTPGEFVVNRSAVRRGNNLQILRAMNSGNNMSVGATKNMRTGGQVGYYNNGGIVDGIASAFSNAFPQLTNIFNGFSSAVDKLVTSQLSLRLDTTNINVNLNGGSFLEKMKEDVRVELIAYISKEIANHKPNSTGDLQRNSSVLGR